MADALLDGTWLDRANLQEVRGLTQEQIANSYWDEDTVFPDSFEPPPMRKD